MAVKLEKARRFAEDYRNEASSTWAEIKAQHDEAMHVYDAEDIVGYGNYAMSLWLRTVERWHDWVSEDAQRYDDAHHEIFVATERLLLSTNNDVLQMVDAIKRAGFDVKGETKFRKLAKQVSAAADPLSSRMVELAELEAEALKQTELQEIDVWGD